MTFLAFYKEQKKINPNITDDEISELFMEHNNKYKFKKMLIEKYQNIDVDKLLSLIDANIDLIEVNKNCENAKNNNMINHLKSDLNKNIIFVVVSKYLENLVVK